MIRYLLTLFLILSFLFSFSQTVESRKSGFCTDPQTWMNGIMPSENSDVIINKKHTVTFDTSITVCSITVKEGGTVSYNRKQTVELSSKGNVSVYGRWVMNPLSASVEHTLRFININNEDDIGGGMDIFETDEGLWARDGGTLELNGTEKTAWLFLAGAAKKGDKTISLNATPKGWRVGDELSIAPNSPPDSSRDHYKEFDKRKIVQIVRGLVTLDSPLTYSHPVVVNPFTGDIYTAEVMNLTRNVKIVGKGAHINIMTNRPSTINYVEIDSLGAKKKDSTSGVRGRYPLHDHHNMDGSRGSVRNGVVAKNSENHGFVPHASHGITYNYAIAYNIKDDAFWWDVAPDKGKDTFNFSNDIKFYKCISAIVKCDPSHQCFRTANFHLGSGTGNSIIECRGIGNYGNANAPSFHWPETSNADPNLWVSDSLYAHNNKTNGIFSWQNDRSPHRINHYFAWNNGYSGIEHGAYANSYKYENIYLINNGYGVIQHGNAIPKTGTPDEDGYIMSFRNVHSTDPLLLTRRIIESPFPVLYKNCTFSKVIVDELPNGRGMQSGLVDFVNCNFTPESFEIKSMMEGSRIRVQDKGKAFQITTKGIKEIPLFAK